ncbi:MAG: chemotaxis protein CheX [Verrucomicrobiota bacterium]
MASIDITCDEDYPEIANPPFTADGVVGSVSVTGKLNGVVYLVFPPHLARKVCDSILGDDPSRSNQEENDVIGEFTNMVTGNLKSKMADKGFNCKLSIPTVLRGNPISIDVAEGNLSLSNQFKVDGTQDVISTLVFAKLDE